MHLVRLEVTDVRSYRQASIDLRPGVTVFVGRNGQGKTNLVEAVVRAATGASHRVAGDSALVRAGEQIGIIRARVVTDDGRTRSLDLEIGAGRRLRTRVDGHDVRRASEVDGVIRAVVFAPEDLAIVRGDPAERRRFLDDLLSSRRPAYGAVRADYDRVLRQRNQLLKQARGLSAAARERALSTLRTWTDQLVGHGARVLAARIAGVHALSGPVDARYRWIADRPEPITLTYQPSGLDAVVGTSDAPPPDVAALADAMHAALADRADDEVRRGVTLVGPHRDDLDLTIGTLPARTHASQGEAWSLALACKLGTYEVVAEVGDRPVVVLDDVFSELDTIRRQRLADACRDWEQVLVTAAVEQDVPLQGRRVDVRLDDGISSLHPRPAAVGDDPGGMRGVG